LQSAVRFAALDFTDSLQDETTAAPRGQLTLGKPGPSAKLAYSRSEFP